MVRNPNYIELQVGGYLPTCLNTPIDGGGKSKEIVTENPHTHLSKYSFDCGRDIVESERWSMKQYNKITNKVMEKINLYRLSVSVVINYLW